jgi:hypothetical protein
MFVPSVTAEVDCREPPRWGEALRVARFSVGAGKVSRMPDRPKRPC